jgi:16S rRNA (uracil1498-N3)-methyltransferase
MRVPRLYVECVEQPVSGRAELLLPGDASNYLQRVLRLRVGDELTVFDGSGGEHGARVLAFARAGVRIVVGDARDVECESPLAITLWQAPARGDRMDHVVEKATELGVRTIVPWLAERSVVRLEGARAEQRRTHWQAVARSACEQCGRNRIPAIETPKTLADLIAHCPPTALRLALRPDAQTRPGALGGRQTEIVIVVGPEGGMTRAEELTLEDARFVALGLGPRVLRADTAGPACIAALQALWGDG